MGILEGFLHIIFSGSHVVGHMAGETAREYQAVQNAKIEYSYWERKFIEFANAVDPELERQIERRIADPAQYDYIWEELEALGKTDPEMVSECPGFVRKRKAFEPKKEITYADLGYPEYDSHTSDDLIKLPGSWATSVTEKRDEERKRRYWEAKRSKWCAKYLLMRKQGKLPWDYAYDLILNKYAIKYDPTSYLAGYSWNYEIESNASVLDTIKKHENGGKEFYRKIMDQYILVLRADKLPCPIKLPEFQFDFSQSPSGWGALSELSRRELQYEVGRCFNPIDLYFYKNEPELKIAWYMALLRDEMEKYRDVEDSGDHQSMEGLEAVHVVLRDTVQEYGIIDLRPPRKRSGEIDKKFHIASIKQSRADMVCYMAFMGRFGYIPEVFEKWLEESGYTEYGKKEILEFLDDFCNVVTSLWNNKRYKVTNSFLNGGLYIDGYKEVDSGKVVPWILF